MINWDLAVCSRYVRTAPIDCFVLGVPRNERSRVLGVHVLLFKGGAPRTVALAAQANRRFLFAKLFLLGLFPQKKKRYKGKLTFDTKTF